jgi:hypothetical protein
VPKSIPGWTNQAKGMPPTVPGLATSRGRLSISAVAMPGPGGSMPPNVMIVQTETLTIPLEAA